MTKRIVQKTFTLEQQRQEINLIADDVNDLDLLDTVDKNSIVDAINEVISTPKTEVFLEQNDIENEDKPILFAQSLTLSNNYTLDPLTNPNDYDFTRFGYDDNSGVTYNPSSNTIKSGYFQGDIKNSSGEVILDSGDTNTLAQYTGLLKTTETNPPINVEESLITLTQNAQLALQQGSEILLETGIDIGASINITNSQQVIYVNAQDANASDAQNNRGNNLNRPFKSIERALVEAARRSYVVGLGIESGEPGADKFEFFSIILFPGEYIIDNSPGNADEFNILPDTDPKYETTVGFGEELYRFNSTNGGLIVPRGTSIVGLDLRKTIVRPKYVPDPVNGNRSAMFRLTGGCYIWQFTLKDDLQTEASHHKLSGFEYASYEDLDAYYRKIDAYSGLNTILDDVYNQRVEENRIVGFVQNKYTSDTVSSASPYVFNISLRSVWGMCGLSSDGARATGLKSMVLAQYTGISLQRDDRAFIFNGATTNLIDDPDRRHTESTAEYRDDWRHFHIKSSNNGFLQVVSVFAVGQADHFMAETGGDHSITNSNSNFGNRSISCISHRPEAFRQDNGAYVVGILPPRGLDPNAESSITVSDIDFKATLKKYNDAAQASNSVNFRKVYLTIGGKEFIKETEVPEYYSVYNNESIGELLVDDINYILGKRRYGDNVPEAIYCKLPKNYEVPSVRTFAARLRSNQEDSVLDFKGDTITDRITLDPKYTYSEGVINAYAQTGVPKAPNSITGPIGTRVLRNQTDTEAAPTILNVDPGTYIAKPSDTTNQTATFQIIVQNNGSYVVNIAPGKITGIIESGIAVDGTTTYDNINEGGLGYTYSGVNGVGAQFRVIRINNKYIVYILNPGNNYLVGETFTILGDNLGGGPANNLTFTISSLDTSGSGYGVNNFFRLTVSDLAGSDNVYVKISTVVLPRNVLVNTIYLLDYISPTSPLRNYILLGDGYNALFNVSVLDGGSTTSTFDVTLLDGGSGFAPQQTVFFPGSLFNGDDTGANDLIINISSVTGDTIETKNNVRKYYGWEYARKQDGEYLGRLCLLVDDFRSPGNQTIFGVPTYFDYTTSPIGFVGYEPNQTLTDYIATAVREETTYSRSISNITGPVGGVFTVTTASRHGFYPGDIIQLANISPTIFNQEEVEVIGTPSNTTFTIALTGIGTNTYSTGGQAIKVAPELTIAVKLTIDVSVQGTGTITDIYPFNFNTSLCENTQGGCDNANEQLFNTGWEGSGSGLIGEFVQGQNVDPGDVLTLNIGAGTDLIPSQTGSITFSIATTTNLTGRPYSSEDIKEESYLTSSSLGIRYASYDTTKNLVDQRPKNLSLLKRLTQRIDSTNDGSLAIVGDSFEFSENTINSVFMKRIQDSRSSNGNTEILWRLICKLPKEGYNNIRLRAPEPKFTIQLKDPALEFPFTYKEKTDPDYAKYPSSFYVSRVEPITEYKYNEQDGYYLLTILDGNVYLDVEENPLTNTITYGKQRLVGFNSSNEIDHLAQDASDLIEQNRTFIQKETFGYLINKYPYIYFSDDDASTNRFKDGARLIQLNKDEIQDKALAELAVQYNSYPNDWIIPGDTNPGRGRFYDAYRLIQLNRANIIETAYTASGGSIISDPEGIKCRRDIGYFIDAISLDVFLGSNIYARKFTQQYFTGTVLNSALQGEVTQSVAAFNSARDEMILAMRNLGLITDPTVTADPGTPDCVNVASAITTLSLIVTSNLTSGTLSLPPVDERDLEIGGSKCRRDIGYIVDVVVNDISTGGNAFTIEAVKFYFNTAGTALINIDGEGPQTVDSFEKASALMQLAVTNQLYEKDLTITADPLTGSNIDPSSCDNVRSAIDTLVLLITSRITAGNLSGGNALPAVNYGTFSDSGKCKRDVGYLLNGVINDLRIGANSNTIDTAAYYFGASQTQFIDGEVSESIDAYEYLRHLTILAMRNWDTYLTGSVNTVGVITVPSTNGLVVGMEVRQVSALPTAATSYATPTAITTNLPAGTHYIRSIDRLNNTVTLGSTRFGVPYNGVARTTTTGSNLFFYFKLVDGLGTNWTTPGTESPIVDTTIIEDYYTGSTWLTGGASECAPIVSTINTLYDLINNILSSKRIILTAVGTTATATITGGHGLTGSPTITIFGSEQKVFSGNVQVTVTSANTFTYTLIVAPETTTDYGLFTSTFTRVEATRSTYSIEDIELTGLGYSQNINYLYPEVDLDNPKWNPKPSVSRWNKLVGNCTLKNNTLVADQYERVTQYSITAESMKNFINGVLSGGDLSDKTFGKLNFQREFGIPEITNAAIEAPYLNTDLNEYGVNKSPVLEFDSNDNPIFTDRCFLFNIPIPVALYRPSIIRASSHTWEYVGFGPGNYSTALPQFQDITLTLQERVNSQSLEKAGGFVASSGTNSFGDFYIGNQVIDATGNNTNTLNFPRVKTSAENRLIDFTDRQSLAANSSTTAFTPSQFSKTLTDVLSAIQESQRNAFKAANIESSVSTTNTLKVNGKIVIANNVFDSTANFPESRQDQYGFSKRASINWFNNDPTSEEYEALADSFISPVDLTDWANKNSLIPSTPVPWIVNYAIPTLFSESSNVGTVDIIETFKKSSNFTVQGINTIDTRWYDLVTDTLQIPLGRPIDSEDQTGVNLYEGRAGLIYLSFNTDVKASAIIPTDLWYPVDNNWNGVSSEDGSPTTYLQGSNFIIGYYISGGKIIYSTNVVTSF
jgi:hypothetical protein